MADGISVTPGAGKNVATDEVVDGTLGTVHAQFIKIMDGTLDGTTKAAVTSIGLKVDLSGNPILPGAGITITSTTTRPSNTTQYAVNDAWANSDSPPALGTLTNAARATGGLTQLADLLIVSSNAAATPLQGEVWIFDTAPTTVADNAAFTVSDAEMLTCVARIPFALETVGANSSWHLPGLGAVMHAGASANLYYLIRVANAYQPISAETLTLRAKFVYLT